MVWFCPFPSLPDVASRLGMRVSGSPPKICCPFHDDRVPSMALYEDHYHCFGCGRHGGVVEFVAAVLGCGLSEARLWLSGALHTAEKSRSYRGRIERRGSRLRAWVADTERSALMCLYALRDLARLAESVGNVDLAMAAYADAWLWEDPERGVLARLERMDPEDVEREFSERKRWVSVHCDAVRKAVCLPLALRLMAEREAEWIHRELRLQVQELRVFLKVSEKNLSKLNQALGRARSWRWRRQGAGR